MLLDGFGEKCLLDIPGEVWTAHQRPGGVMWTGGVELVSIQLREGVKSPPSSRSTYREQRKSRKRGPGIPGVWIPHREGAEGKADSQQW